MYSSWALGFITGAGWNGGTDPLGGTDAEGVLAWFDNYCAANPLKTIADGAVEFYHERQRR
jgi:hypothetical protein